MIKAIHHVQLTIPSGHETIARSFYCEILGLAEIPKPASLVQKGGFWIQCQTIQIHISIQNNVDRYALNSHLCFEVTDLEFWMNKLKSASIVFDSNDSITEGERLMFRDPCGNRLELLERQ